MPSIAILTKVKIIFYLLVKKWLKKTLNPFSRIMKSWRHLVLPSFRSVVLEEGVVQGHQLFHKPRGLVKKCMTINHKGRPLHDLWLRENYIYQMLMKIYFFKPYSHKKWHIFSLPMCIHTYLYCRPFFYFGGTLSMTRHVKLFDFISKTLVSKTLNLNLSLCIIFYHGFYL